MKRILVIEDDMNIRESIDDLLQMKGYETLVAENGEAGLALSAENEFDLVICDIMMPGIDGYGVLKEMRKNYKTVNVPFIFLTAKSQKEDLRSGMRLGADDYLTKPFVSQELFDAIETRLKRQEDVYERISDDLRLLNVRTNNLVQNELIETAQSIGNFSDLIINNIDCYSNNEMLEVANLIKGKSVNLNRRLRNLILFQALRGAMIGYEINRFTKKGHTGNASSFIKSIVLPIAESAGRELDLNIGMLSSSSVALYESNFAVILDEIVRNAFEHSSIGKLVSINTEETYDTLTIKVSNYGNPIPHRVQHLIESLEVLTERNNGFSGYGLYLAAHLVNKAGGTIRINREDCINEVVIKLNK